ncbi:MAG TPA: DUF695 domain-containing protein [Thermoplasmata archaeon]|nr:DUF695 domain-containing protein [Thermoplasmata archaeon]
MGLFDRKHPPRAKIDLRKYPRNETRTGPKDGDTEIVRWRDVKKALVGHPEYRHHVGLAIPIQGDPVGGLPSKEELGVLDRLEAVISGSIERDCEAIIVGSLTSHERRGYIIYTSNPAGTEAKLKELETKSAPYPLMRKTSEDPEWNHFLKYFKSAD